VKILVIDIGGSKVKMLASGQPEPRKFESHDKLAPQEMVDQVREMTKDWEYEAISLGVPGVVGPSGPEMEPPPVPSALLTYTVNGAEAAVSCADSRLSAVCPLP
jgi:predicted NBD/HSP70 family sugar kinase